jgi:hypothetical protein
MTFALFFFFFLFLARFAIDLLMVFYSLGGFFFHFSLVPFWVLPFQVTTHSLWTFFFSAQNLTMRFSLTVEDYYFPLDLDLMGPLIYDFFYMYYFFLYERFVITSRTGKTSILYTEQNRSLLTFLAHGGTLVLRQTVGITILYQDQLIKMRS